MKTKQDLQVAIAIAEAIRSLGEVPSGHLYARVMGHLTLDQYNATLQALKLIGLVSESNHVLKWVR